MIGVDFMFLVKSYLELEISCENTDVITAMVNGKGEFRDLYDAAAQITIESSGKCYITIDNEQSWLEMLQDIAWIENVTLTCLVTPTWVDQPPTFEFVIAPSGLHMENVYGKYLMVLEPHDEDGPSWEPPEELLEEVKQWCCSIEEQNNSINDEGCEEQPRESDASVSQRFIIGGKDYHVSKCKNIIRIYDMAQYVIHMRS